MSEIKYGAPNMELPVSCVIYCILTTKTEKSNSNQLKLFAHIHYSTAKLCRGGCDDDVSQWQILELLHWCWSNRKTPKTAWQHPLWVLQDLETFLVPSRKSGSFRRYISNENCFSHWFHVSGGAPNVVIHSNLDTDFLLKLSVSVGIN